MAQLRTISGPGGYQLCVGGPGPDTREIASSVCTGISKQMESCFLDNKDSDLGAGEFLTNLLNDMSWLPDHFDNIIFDSFPDAIPLPDDPKDPSQLLHAVVIDRSSLALPSSCFHSLKNLSAEDLNSAIYGLKSLMDDWRKDMDPDLLMAMSEFCHNNRDHLVGFTEYWNPRAEAFKKKKGTTSFEHIDDAFFQYLDKVRGFGQIFDMEFMLPRYLAATSLVSPLQALCGDVLSKKLNDMEKYGIDKYHKAVLESCSSGGNFVLKPEHKESVQENVEAVQHKIEALLNEFYHEIDTVNEQCPNEHQKTTIGRLEKSAHKEFKKRVFAADIMINIFPEQQLAQMALVTLISIMQEGEQMECDQMDDFMFEFVEENEDILTQRIVLILDFEGTYRQNSTSKIARKVILNEGMRLQGDSLALKRQNNLLKSIGMASESPVDASNLFPSSGSIKKKKKKKKKTASAIVPSQGEKSSVDISSDLLDKPTPDESALQEDNDSSVIKEEDNGQSIPALITKETTPIMEQPAAETESHQLPNKKNATSKADPMMLDTKPPIQEEENVSSVPAESGPTIWQELKTEGSDHVEVNDTDVQLKFDLSRHTKLQAGYWSRYNSIRPANDNNTRLPPGLKVASPAISHTSATSLDRTSQQQPANVLAMIAHLQAENGQLVNAFLSVQQELNNMNIREREAIKVNEMGEARRYILKLEAKLHLLEQDDASTFDPYDHGAGQRRQERKRQPLSKSNRPLSTGGGDNQDRRRTNNMWLDTRTVKCGNCGEPGHKSADCQTKLIYQNLAN
ncbi:hypothetical protein BGW37DRAFT_549948 [Umbelopsis sp. PMI_123]|nr:hypothetical protein BGW37DRAFT_549948 [Umbelopsis sp. PMI_123]